MTEKVFVPLAGANGLGYWADTSPSSWPRSWPADTSRTSQDVQTDIDALYRWARKAEDYKIVWTDNDGIERECPHDKYGDRIPTHEDITAISKLLQMGWDNHDPLIQQFAASYLRQFCDVAGPEKGG